MFALAWLSPADWQRRLALAVFLAVAVAAFHAVTWPHCIHRLEGVSPEVEELWLSHVREARPIYRHGWRIASLVLALPVTGAIGWGLLAWIRRTDADLLRRIVGAAAPGLAATILLFWQTRTGPAAQLMATVGAAALVWFLFPTVWNAKWSPARVLGSVVVVLAGAGAAVPLIVDSIPEEKPTPQQAAIGRANRLCNSMWGLRAVALEPKGRVFTFVDLGPRLIAVTHHDSVIGPYHRNGAQIADVMNAFRGSESRAHAIMRKYRSDYLLICPYSSTTTIFMSETPKGFYGQLQRGQIPKWLTPVRLPKDSPFRMWRLTG
jgi:hypothetical protein